MSKLGPNCQYFVWPPLFSSTALTLLGMEFTRTSQVSTGVLFHSSMMTSQSWWMLETLCSSTFRLKMPHRLPLPSASLARQWSSWRCVWGGYHVGILPCSPISKGRGACSASVCHSCRASSHRMMTNRHRGFLRGNSWLLRQCTQETIYILMFTLSFICLVWLFRM